MRQSLIAFAAIYAVVLGTSSCGGGNNERCPAWATARASTSRSSASRARP